MISVEKEGRTFSVPETSILFIEWSKKRSYLSGRVILTDGTMAGFVTEDPADLANKSTIIPCHPGWSLVSPFEEIENRKIVGLSYAPIVAWAVGDGVASPICPGWQYHQPVHIHASGEWEDMLVLPPSGMAIGQDGTPVCDRDEGAMIDYLEKERAAK